MLRVTKAAPKLPVWPATCAHDNKLMQWWLDNMLKVEDETIRARQKTKPPLEQALELAEQGRTSELRYLIVTMFGDERVGRFINYPRVKGARGQNKKKKPSPGLVEEGARVARRIERLWRTHYPNRPRRKNNIEWPAARFAAHICQPTFDEAIGDHGVRSAPYFDAETLAAFEKSIKNRLEAKVDIDPS